MNKSKNTFLKSKMNKDIDARILPNNEYRNAVNVQVNKSEGANVGSLENVRGNISVANIATHTGVGNLKCIGTLQDESSSISYLFFTDNDEVNYQTSTKSNHFIISFNSNNNALITLVKGPFLNFSTLSPVYASNIIENLLFWTDNRNQPRKINVDFANTNTLQNPTYYTTEDQISVAKYNPHDCIEMYAESTLSTSATTQYESTMKDVSSLNLPNGGNGELNAPVALGANSMIVKNFVGDIQVQGSTTYDSGATVSYVDASGNVQTIASAVVSGTAFSSNLWTITISGATFPTALDADTVIILNANPYYDSEFAGDPTYLDDKFVRFSYRFKFDDNEYSLFSTFTQAAFIPKQDGYFMYVQKDDLKKVNNESEASRSTIVNFVENKVDQIKLRIPLPFKNYNLRNALKVTEIDILYKESDQIPVKVIDTISESDIYNASASCLVKSATTSSNTVTVDNIVGGIQVGSPVTGFGITTRVTVLAYTPDNPNVNPSTTGTIALSSNQTLAEDVELTIGEPNYYVYDYQSKKPFRTLPERDLIRVYDKIPVKALAQEISGNRVIYGNYLNKYTAPEFINYNLAITDKAAFSLNGGTAQINGSFPIGSTTITLTNIKGEFLIGMEVISDGVAPGTLITGINGSNITLDTPTIGVLVNLQLVVLEPGGTEQNTTSRIEYPSSSLKTNRNYQVGIVLSDRYGRQSGVILSNNKEVSVSGSQTFIGSTIYSPYNTPTTSPNSWPGDSIKLIFNNQIATEYNGDVTSPKYNPLGWYSYKIVVKQTEQEYYNVYLPGIMAGYPEDLTLEQGQTSHVVLTSDNINKIPRDLNEVGPTQDQFRSSVKLYGRVENSPTVIVDTNPGNFGLSNLQYYPGREFDIAITISPMNDLFDYNPLDPPTPNYFPQFYTYTSNPYIARISTASTIGQLANLNYTAVSGFAAVDDSSSTIRLYNVSGITADIAAGDSVTGPGFPQDLITLGSSPFTGENIVGSVQTSQGSTGLVLTFQNTVTIAVIGQVLTGAGIASGTVITDIQGNLITMNQAAAVILGTTVTFTNPAQLVVDQQVSFQEGDPITISSSLKPGIQYLAVYETEPVQSLLDIFWESSTTGIIQDINNIILNENTGGVAAGSLAPFNTSVFKEDLRRDPTSGVYPNITVDPFGLVDNFEQPITSGVGPLSLDAVLNGYGEDVQTIYLNGSTVTPVFSFAETGSNTGLYNIKIAEGFGRNIYFGEDALLHTFTFKFSATVNNLETLFEREVVLGNVQPYFYTWEGTSFKALRAQTNVTEIDVYDEGPSASNIIAGFRVYNNTNPSAWGSNVVTDGTSFTITPNASGVLGAPNNLISAVPFPTGTTQTGSTITFGPPEEWAIGSISTIEVNNLVAFDPDFTTQSNSSIPAGTYVVSFANGAAGSNTKTATFSNSITTTHAGNGFTGFGEGVGDAIQFWVPNYLKVLPAVSVAKGDLIYVFDTPNWNNCPIGPIYTGSANLEVVTTLKGVNGAGFNINDLFGTNQGLQKWKDLYCEITSVVNSSGENADQYFQLSNGGQMVQGSSGLGEVNLLNTGYQDNAMPADVYTVNLKIHDPGDSSTCAVTVNTGLKLCTTQPSSQFGDAPYGVREYTVTATPKNASSGLATVIRKYLIVSICEDAAGFDPTFGGNGSNGFWIWKGNSDGQEANPSWQDCVAAAGGSNIVLQGPGNCSSGFNGANYLWDDLPAGGSMGVIWGERSLLLQVPCANITLSDYNVTIQATAGTGTGVPLNPPVSEYVFTI